MPCCTCPLTSKEFYARVFYIFLLIFLPNALKCALLTSNDDDPLGVVDVRLDDDVGAVSVVRPEGTVLRGESPRLATNRTLH